MLTEQHLVTGWERDVDVADTLLRRFVCHLAALDAVFTVAACGRTLDADDVSMADLGRPGGYFNGAVLLRPPADWDDSLTRIERFAAGGRGQFCLWSVWPTPDLRARRWRLSGHPPLLIRPPVSISPVDASSTPHLEVRQVISPSDLAAWERTAIDTSLLNELGVAPVGSLASPALLDDDRLRFLVGWDEGRPSAAAISFASHGIASLALDPTSPTARRHGFWGRLVTEAVAATPDLWIAGVLSDDRRREAETLGFVPVVRLSQWILDRP